MSKKSSAEQVVELEKKLAERDAYIEGLERKLQSRGGAVESGGAFVDPAELELALAQALNSSRAKSEFLMSMGHELRTPLNGIMGMTNLVLETRLNSGQRRHLEMVNSSAERLLEVVNDIVDFCRLESGLLKLCHEDFSMAGILDCDLYLMKWSARQKNVDLNYQIAADVPERLTGDPDRLVQVVTSLMDNAIKFTEQGSVTLLVEYLGEDERGRIVLKFLVKDTGIGLSKEQQILISERLTQDSADYSRTFWGGGLGLSVSAQLVHLADGQIGLESSEEGGATFWFTWTFDRPIKTAHDLGQPRERTEPVPVAPFRFDNNRLLLAEDEPISRILIETLLDQTGLQINSVDNGLLAVEEAATGKYQAILMDVQMSVMDGLEATKRIRTDERQHGGHLPIIALTAHAMHGDREKCLQAGMDDYLTKPVAKSELFDMLGRYLTRTALLVDSDPQSRQRIVEFLIESGWRVTLSETARSAAYEASLGHFDLILLDMREDIGDATETPRLIRRLEEFSGRRALILGLGSNLAGDSRLFAYRKSGVDDFLKHPLDLLELAEKIEHHLEGLSRYHPAE